MGLTRELEAKRAQLRALDEELAAQKQRMEEEVRAHAAGLMIGQLPPCCACNSG